MKCEKEAKATEEPPGYWSCQEHRRLAKGSRREWAEPAQESGHVGCSQQSHRGGASQVPWFPIMNHVPQVLNMELRDLVLALLAHSLTLVRVLFGIFLFFPLGMGMGRCTLCHCVLEVCSFLLGFYRASWGLLRRDIRLGLCDNIGPVQIWGTLG
jgi:hypothetical protein